MSFYEVSKVLDKRTDAHGRVQYLVRWRGYGKKFDSWVDENDTNERLKQVFRTRHQGTPGLLQTLAVLVADKLNNTKEAFVILFLLSYPNSLLVFR